MNPMAFLLLRKRNKPKNRSQNLFCGGLGGCVYWGWGGPLLKVWEEIKITFHKFICRKIHSEEHILKRKAECDQWVSSSAPCCLTLPSHPAKFSNSGKEGLTICQHQPPKVTPLVNTFLPLSTDGERALYVCVWGGGDLCTHDAGVMTFRSTEWTGK